MPICSLLHEAKLLMHRQMPPFWPQHSSRGQPPQGSRLLLRHATPQKQCLVSAAQGDKADREKMRAMDAEKVRQEKAQRKQDDALMEPARLAARGLSLEEIEREMQRQGLPVERQFLQRQIEKANRKRAKEEEEPFYAVNKDVSALIAVPSLPSPPFQPWLGPPLVSCFIDSDM